MISNNAGDPPRSTPQHIEYRFGRCTVDPLRRVITHDGQAIDAQPKVFDLPLYLLERRDRIVDKRELLEALWPDAIVTEASLTQAVRKLRQILGDDANRPSVIRTVSRRGFAPRGTSSGQRTCSPPKARPTRPTPTFAALY